MLPFYHNPRLANRLKRLHRLKRAGLTPPTDKASLRAAAEHATTIAKPTIVPPRKRTT